MERICNGMCILPYVKKMTSLIQKRRHQLKMGQT